MAGETERAAAAPGSFDALGEAYDRSRRLPLDVVTAAVVHATEQWCDGVGVPHALEIGCGTGQLLPALASAGWQPFGLDPASTSLRVARQRCPDAYLLEADGTAIPFPARSVGMVVIAHVVEHVAAWRLMVDESLRVTSTGGAVMFISTPGFVRNGPRSAFRQALDRRGWRVRRPGPSSLDELANLLELDGIPVQLVEDAAWTWRREQPIATSLEFLTNKEYSAFWDCPEPLYSEALEETRQEFSDRCAEVETIDASLRYMVIRAR